MGPRQEARSRASASSRSPRSPKETPIFAEGAPAQRHNILNHQHPIHHPSNLLAACQTIVLTHHPVATGSGAAPVEKTKGSQWLRKAAVCLRVMPTVGIAVGIIVGISVGMTLRRASGGKKPADALLDFRTRPAEAAATQVDKAARVATTGKGSVIKVEPRRRARHSTDEQPRPGR